MSESPRFVEATGPDVETAIKNGLTRLNASSKDVIVEVIEESSRGLFGIGGRPAKVRLTLLAPMTPPAPHPSTWAPGVIVHSAVPSPVVQVSFHQLMIATSNVLRGRPLAAPAPPEDRGSDPKQQRSGRTRLSWAPWRHCSVIRCGVEKMLFSSR